MKILHTIMLLYQFAYYAMREEDKRRGRSASITRFRTFGGLCIVELWWLVVAYLVVARIILGHRISGVPYSVSISSAIVAFAFGLVVHYINLRIIGPEGRIHHYKQIFDAWDKWKHFRWKALLIGILVLSAIVFFVVGEVTQNGPNTQNWKY